MLVFYSENSDRVIVKNSKNYVIRKPPHIRTTNTGTHINVRSRPFGYRFNIFL